jgi:hypothetical protein
MAKKIDTSNWSLADKRYGFQLGSDGYVNSVEAARIVSRSQPWMSDVLNGDERKTPGGKGWPIRAAKDRHDKKGWMVCVRSLHEYMRTNQPVEV